MIIKGKSRAAPSSLASYLLQKRGNESVDFKGAFGTVPQELKEALGEMAIIAAASNCKNYLYHASINPPEGEHLTPEQWDFAVDLLAKNLGLEGHQRAVVEHVKDGRAHYHVVFNRVNPETLKAVRMSHSYRKHEQTSRELERELNLDHVPNSFDRDNNGSGGQQEKAYSQKDFDQARRTKVDPRMVAADLSAAWQESENGADFIKRAEERGYVIAQGDKRDFVAIDKGGGIHSVARRTKTKTADVRAKMEDIDLAQLPNVEAARDQQQHRVKEEQELKVKERDGHKAATLYDSGSMAEQQKDALRHTRDKYNIRQQQAREDQQRQQDEHARQIGQGATAGKEKTSVEQRLDERQKNTEMTAEQIRQRQREITREIFERAHGKQNTQTLENTERGRGGRDRER